MSKKMRDEIVIGVGNTPRLTKEEQANASRQELFDSAQRYAMGVVGGILSKIHSFSRDERNLVMQEGLLGLWLATGTYDASKGSSIATYAHMQIQYRALQQIRIIFNYRNSIQGLEDSSYSDVEVRRERGKDIIRRFEWKEYIAYIMDHSNLDEQERVYITRYYGLDGDTPKKLHEVTEDVTKQRVEQVLKRGLKKMRNTIEREERFL